MAAELETNENRLQILQCLRLTSLFPNHPNSYPQAKNEKEKSKFHNSLDKLQKAFDFVHHDWILKCLDIYRCSVPYLKNRPVENTPFIIWTKSYT